MHELVSIRVNGQTLTVRTGLTLGELVTQWGLPARGLLVEVNQEVLPQNQWPTYALQQGDVIELVRITAGG
ncbi:sulfur carrier protein ThiS [Candidatus Methylacidithermus pantelleriae]|uniref:Thiamine biosynthesis protein ThiS n=1 Tax=Candidatus Methylacidithermus pantelleriae TaxID=2744239 RepID=A0A8J2BM35_9BACT|nr:sulfur carrier protein ThiS [Candidatus Methylacidithermus pantelleriae]CAF0689144.1 Thiamine biosynthesis protein ThiS [Candidatus Methylacidithermus pantelleriae]